MEQKFVKFEEAVEKLGITSERLNQLREGNELRAYRDGSSWKFRADEIERLVTEGIPDSPPPSDISLIGADELVDSSPLASLDDLDDLELAVEDDFSIGSELELAEDQDDTVTAGGSDPQLSIHDEPVEANDPSDSILLSEEELGESLPAASTIIGSRKQNSPDADLELVTEDDLSLDGSDVALAGGASNVLNAGVAGSGVLDELEKGSGATSAFEDLEELELDLAAESSLILSPGGVADAAEPKGGQFAQQQAPPDSDLKIEDDLELDDGTDPVPEIDLDAGKSKANAGPTSDLELATDEDDFVLATDGGSDITLDSGDSGINLSPSDSGLALDDIPLEIGGSAILDSLTLGGGNGESDLSLVGSDIKPAAAPKLQTDDSFRLTPLNETDDDGDSSSQVIALDADLGDLGGAEEAGLLGDDAFAEIEGDDGVVLSDDYGDGAPGEFEMAAFAGAPAASRSQSEYSLMNIIGLASCFFLMMFAGVLSLDLVRNIWSWEDNLALNDSLLESIGGMLGMR